MLDIDILFFDLDGTLLDDNRIISKDSITELKELSKQGKIIVLASGRFNQYAYRYAKELECVNYIISNNGSLIYDVANNSFIYKISIDNRLLNVIWDYSIKNELGLTLNSNDKRYSNIYSTTSEENNVIINSLDEIKEETYQFVFNSYDRNKIKNLLTFLEDYKLNINYISNTYYTLDEVSISVDVNLNNISKGTAALYIMNKLNIDKEKSICFGDGINDIDIFNVCHYKVAMNNACNELKHLATHITDSNNDNGISNFISKHIK